jgi:NitT/TauT family transport system ATP-binding protein
VEAIGVSTVTGSRHTERGVPPTDGGQVTLERVTMRFGEQLVVSDCSLLLEPGGVTAMVGPSGCGKSTIGFLVAGYHSPSEGEVRLDGRPVRGPSHERLLVFQETSLMPWLTTIENVMFGPRARGIRRRDARRDAAQALERVGLEAFADSYPSQLSGGMQRRAELARALVNDPRVLVLDEPFRGLDAMTRGLMQQYYAELSQDSAAVSLFITTDIDEALLVADRLLIMANLPTRVREVIDVELPRPRRRESTLRDPRAARIKQQALELLRAEAMRSFDFALGSEADGSSTTDGERT